MANVSRVNGFRPVKHLDGSPFNGQVNRYFVAAADATAIYNGDLVKLAAVTDSVGTQGATKYVAGTDTAALGVVVGFQVEPILSQTKSVDLNSPQYRPASTAMYILVADAADVVYEVQANAVLSATQFNKNASVVDGGGSAVTGFSGEQLDVASIATVGTTATATLKILGAVQKVDNDITSTNAKLLVMINNHQLSHGTGTAGV